MKLLKIQHAIDKQITIKEPLTFQANVLKNQIWYRGDAAEIEQFYKQSARFDVDKAKFWASVPTGTVRKMHVVLPGTIIDRYKDIIISDLDAIDFGEEGEETPLLDIWSEIAEDNKFEEVLADAIQGALSGGDGAFKISIDTDASKYPILEFYTADNVEFNYKRGRLFEILFYTSYVFKDKEYRLEEAYGKGYINYKLYDPEGKEVPITTLEETKHLVDVTFDGDFILGQQLMFFKSAKWKGRGKALLDGKCDNLDALDEVISQWLDAIRQGRVQKYIPEDMIPRDAENGSLLPINDFDNRYLKIASSLAENAESKIEVVQPEIAYSAYLESYSNFLDLCLQGIMSPSTLGIDLKKTDNAESQREKEKITVHVRQCLVNVLNDVIPNIVNDLMKTYDIMQGHNPGEYKSSVKFGEYASPGFDNVVETVGKAKTYGVMSTEQCIEEMYGDTWTEEEKAEEVARIKLENNMLTEEPTMQNDEDLEGEGTTSLNGAQITSMLGVVKSVATGELTRNAAISIITSTLGVSRENAEQFIDDKKGTV